MEPTRGCQDKTLEQMIPPLDQDVMCHIGRLLVESPALHLFLPASIKLAECATKVFVDFASAGGDLKFISSSNERVFAFVSQHRIETVNMSNSRHHIPNYFYGLTQIKTLVLGFFSSG